MSHDTIIVLSFSNLDPSLTSSNILSAMHRVPLWGREDSYNALDMPQIQHDETVERFDGEEAKEQLITTWLDGHPCPTWEHVRDLLRDRVGGEVGKRAAGEVEETYLKSELLLISQVKFCSNCAMV